MFISCKIFPRKRDTLVGCNKKSIAFTQYNICDCLFCLLEYNDGFEIYYERSH